MKQKNESESITLDKHATPAIIGRKETAPLSIHDTARGITINFHSAEFNHPDDLCDHSGNYRSFEPLGGVVTADMRHQMELRRCKETVDSPADDTVPLENAEQESDKTDAVEAPTPFIVISHGRTLIIDTNEERAITCSKILSDNLLTCTVLVTKNAYIDTSFPRLRRPQFIEVNTVSVTGAFGGFSAMITLNGEEKDLMEPLENRGAVFDLVLDLQPVPSFAGDRLPMGYYAPGQNLEDLAEVMATLPEMRGCFKKPQFTYLRKNHCFHGRSRNRDCRRCLDICPFNAIQSAGREISINHHLCQNCGGCALVCPADAICMVHPSQEKLLDILQRTLDSRKADAAFPQTLLISDSQITGNDIENDQIVNFRVEEIGYIGLEVILAALSYGANRVVVACGSQNPPKIRETVAWHTQMAVAILKGLGLPQDKIRFVIIPPEDNDLGEGFLRKNGLDAQSSDSPMPTASFSPRQDKRKLIRLAVQHLYDQTGAQQPCISLPDCSSFGAVAVTEGCTLCMACTNACLSGALSATDNIPRLSFYESRCHQCGLCEEACPENAIKLLPRILCDQGKVETEAVLHEAEPFRCVECGMPFASPGMITRMQEKLKDHWMYADERQLSRLRMCGICRTRDTFISGDLKSWKRK